MKFFGSLPVVLLLLLFNSCSISDPTWDKVRNDLIVIKEKDARYRNQMDSVGRAEGWHSKSVEALWVKQKALDSVNLVDVDRILTRYGYPPKAKVGELCEVPFTIIQHAHDSTISTYYEVIIGAGKNGDLRMRDVAQYQDKILLMERQPQEYGTQIWIEFKKDPTNGRQYDSIYLWPVRDRMSLNSKRVAVGLDSIEVQLRRYGIDPVKGYLIRRTSPASN